MRVRAEGKKRMQHLRITILGVNYLWRLWVSKGEKENVPVVCFPAVGDRAHPVKNGNGEKLRKRSESPVKIFIKIQK